MLEIINRTIRPCMCGVTKNQEKDSRARIFWFVCASITPSLIPRPSYRLYVAYISGASSNNNHQARRGNGVLQNSILELTDSLVRLTKIEDLNVHKKINFMYLFFKCIKYGSELCIIMSQIKSTWTGLLFVFSEIITVLIFVMSNWRTDVINRIRTIIWLLFCI